MIWALLSQGYSRKRYFLFILCCFLPPFISFKTTTVLPVVLPVTLPHTCMDVIFWKVRLGKSFSSSTWTLKYWVMLHAVSPHCNSFCSKMRTNLMRWLDLGLLRSSGTVSFLSTSPVPLVNEQTYRTWSLAGSAVTLSCFCNKASTGADSPGLELLRDGVCNPLRALPLSWDFQQDGKEAKSIYQLWNSYWGWDVLNPHHRGD